MGGENSCDSRYAPHVLNGQKQEKAKTCNHREVTTAPARHRVVEMPSFPRGDPVDRGEKADVLQDEQLWGFLPMF